MQYMIREIYDGKTCLSSILIEVKSKKEADFLVARNPTRWDKGIARRHVRCTPERAHKWVRDGLVHDTGLWLDGGRIRYIRPAPHHYMM